MPTPPASPNFQHSVHLIPSPDSEGKRPPRFRPFVFRWYIWGQHSGIMILLAVAIEIALFFSNKNHGFKVAQKNVLSFGGHISTQFLLSFFPTLLITPVSFLMDSIWFWFRVYQPYVTLAQGNAGASDSVRANYLAYNVFQAVIKARKYDHKILYATGVLSMITVLFQPLASSFFELQNHPQSSPVPYTLKTQQALGLSPEAADLTPFVSAAGYVSASVAQPLGDPPFVDGNWTTASFAKPDNIDYDTVPLLQVNTIGLQTLVNCDVPVGDVSLVPSDDGTVAFSAIANAGFGTGTDGKVCTASLAFPQNSSTQQYGAVAVSGCATNGSAAETIPELQPVMLWFFKNDVAGAPSGAAVFCKPTLGVWSVQAEYALSNMSFSGMEILEGYPSDNNVTGGTNQGRAFNGLIFSNASDSFVAARANTVKSILPGAILKYASLQPAGLLGAFQNQKLFVEYTNILYQRHLAIAAQGLYFVPADTALSAMQVQILPRLLISPAPAHSLALLLLVTGIMTAVLHMQHRRARARLYLAHCPGSIASTVALTGRSGFGHLLVPYETDASLKAKLAPLRFRLDERTGAVLADSDDSYAPAQRSREKPPASPLAKAHFEQQAEDAQSRLLGTDWTSMSDASTAASNHGGSVLLSPTSGGEVNMGRVDHPVALRAGLGSRSASLLVDRAYAD